MASLRFIIVFGLCVLGGQPVVANFLKYCLSGEETFTASKQPIKFSKKVRTEGTGLTYDATTYTAKVVTAGTYLISVTLVSPPNKWAYINMYNKATKLDEFFASANAAPNYEGISYITTLKLAKDDLVSFKTAEYETSYFPMMLNHFSCFEITKIA